MDRIANQITVLWGWRRAVVALLAGALSAVAFAPFDVFPILFATIPVFVWLLDGTTARDGAGRLRALLPAFAVGWCFGFGFFVGGLWWLGAAFLVDAGEFALLMPFAVVALPAGLAVLWGLGAAAARAVWMDGWPRILVFAVALTAAEWLRGHILTGFPWNAFGYALTPTPPMMQSAAVVGLWGLTLAAFVVFAAPAAIAGGEGRRGPGLAFAGFALALLVLHAAFGAVRLAGAGASLAGEAIRIVQPALDQSEKWQTENEDEIVRRYLELSDGATAPERTGVGSAAILVWPESAFPFLLTERPGVLAAIAALLPAGTTLITGAARGEPSPDRDIPSRVFNSVYVIDSDGEIRDAYDKVHLVPFGEYLPLRPLFDAIGIRQLVALPGGFEAGSRRRTMTVPPLPPFGPLICYEIIFPGEATDPADRPRWLLNLTNDTWFGTTPGPYQHFAQARVRAVEEGLPLVRAANSGISAIVDPYGRVTASLGLGVSGIVDGVLPEPLPPTVQARVGNLILVLMVAGSAAAIAVCRFRARRNRN